MSENDNKSNIKNNDEDFDFAKKYKENFTPSSRSGSTPIVQSKIVNKNTKTATSKDTKKSTTGTSKRKSRRARLKSKGCLIWLIYELIVGTIYISLIAFVVAIGGIVGIQIAINNDAGFISPEMFEINNFTTIVYDINGNEYTKLDGAENRTYATIDEVSPYLPKAFVAIEDERFYEHSGVDLKRTAAATMKYITAGDSSFGGSTITQQVIKKVTGDDDHSALRKVKEMISALQLEKWKTKDEILELYMNLIYLGQGSYGVETASNVYFGKSAKDLSIAQCALIGGLAQAPEGMNPYNYPDKALERQKLVLMKMNELGYITDEQYEEAKKEELVYTRGNVEMASSNSYFIDALADQCIKDVMNEKGVTKQMASAIVYNGGLKIYSTLDPKVQDVIDKVYMDEKYFKTRQGYDPELQSAIVIIDYKTGNVVGLRGGAGEKTILRGLNRATGMTRQIGSNMKPIGVYGPGLEAGVLTAATTFDDVPTTFKAGGSAWTVKNYDRTYRGLMSIRKAIELSENVVAAKAMMEKVGTEYSYSFLKKLGITSLTEVDRQSAASLSLGGMHKGVSPLELAAAYGTIANKGVYVEPRLYTRMDDRNDQLYLKKTQDVHDVMSPENAYILTDMMVNVTEGSQGTGRLAQLKGIQVAAKTGTTSDDKDRWFSAFTPYYVASVWFGYDTPKYLNIATNPGTTVWHDIMAEIHKDKKSAKFSDEKPSGVVTYSVCRDSGLLATDACKADQRGSRVYTEIFNSKNGSIPKESCNIHEMVEVCPETFLLPTDSCRAAVGTIKISRLNRHYKEGQPSIQPPDYAYETPSKYCEYHSGGAVNTSPNSKNYEAEIDRVNDAITNPNGTNTTNTTPGNTNTNTETKPEEKKENEVHYEPFWWTRE